MTRYVVRVVDALLDELREHPPVGWTLVAERADPSSRWTYVEVEDPNAPERLRGRLVDPVMRWDDRTGEVTVMTYDVPTLPVPPRLTPDAGGRNITRR